MKFKNREELIASLEAAADRKRYNRMLFFEPYPKQQEFFDLGISKRERLLMAGNQLGKSESGAFEVACHLTGDYPDWWLGRRWNRPVQGWAAGVTGTLTRNVSQRKLCGEPGLESALGTGFIPKDRFAQKPSVARGTADAFDTIWITHRTNGVEDGVSTLQFKSYEQGRTKFQGDTLDFSWEDEEPPEDIYSEIMARFTATDGMSLMTFTPLLGMSKVVIRFLHEKDPSRAVVTMGLEDAKHMTPERMERVLSAYPKHERDARLRGIPMLGSGKIFTTPIEQILEPPIPLAQVPAHWAKAWGIDFGITHPFAAVLAAWDRDADVIHILHTIRITDALPPVHAAAMNAVAAEIPVLWPLDGEGREAGTGEGLARQYKRERLLLTPSHATWEDGTVYTERGVLDMQERMATGRLRVASHLGDWAEEYGMYHRKDGQIVKERDDLLSATRMVIMAKRHMRALPLSPLRAFSGRRRRDGEMPLADGVDFDVWG